MATILLLLVAENVYVLALPSPCGDSPAVFTVILMLSLLRNFPASAWHKLLHLSPEEVSGIWNVKYQYGRATKCSSINGGLFALPEL
jgi:hypothetical protein